MDSLAMAHSNWQDEDYDNHFWPMLRETIDILMLKSSYEPFSYEKVTFSSPNVYIDDKPLLIFILIHFRFADVQRSVQMCLQAPSRKTTL